MRQVGAHQSREHAVLVVDDEPTIRISLRDALIDAGLNVTAASTGDEALALLQSRQYDVVISDIRMPGLSGTDLLDYIQANGDAIPVILITAYGDVEQAVAAIKDGAHDYITKPFPAERAVKKVQDLCLMIDLAEEVERLRAEAPAERGLVGSSRPWRKVIEAIDTAAPTDSTVLVIGESGTGKELVAEAIHDRSARSNGPLVKVHCAALPPTLIESELFGHERGAFTGASSRMSGRFEAASGGTLLLDEVDEIPMGTQVKLLRVVQERVIERLGSPRPIPIDVRIVATTKMDLATLVEQGRLRQDLYYRLAVIELRLPRLVERQADIPLLLQYFLARFQARMNKRIPCFTDDALEALRSFHYPGNVRELEHIVESACAMCKDGEPIGRELLPEILRRSSRAPVPAPGVGADRPLKQAVNEFERTYLASALSSFSGGKGELAARLGISRKHLWTKLKDHGLDGEDPEG